MNRREPVITINFARTDHRLVSGIRSAIFLVIGALLCGLLALLWTARVTQARAEAVAASVRELAASQEKLQPLVREREQVLRDLHAMSGVVDARRFSWTRFLTGIEQAFPAGVALDRLELNPRERAVALEGKARSPEALSGLMIGLERSPSFRSPLLKRQSMDKGILSFNVSVTYHEPAAAGEAAGSAHR